jgi:hypothetical protein
MSHRQKGAIMLRTFTKFYNDGFETILFNNREKVMVIVMQESEDRNTWELLVPHDYFGKPALRCKEVAFTKQGKLGYEFTHSHTDNGDAQCQQLFFWHVEVDTNGKDFVTLPVDRDILVLSVVADTENETCTLSSDLYDKIEGRIFDYKENIKEKLIYLNCKNSYLLNDKGGAIKHRNKGRRK